MWTLLEEGGGVAVVVEGEEGGEEVSVSVSVLGYSGRGRDLTLMVAPRPGTREWIAIFEMDEELKGEE